MRKFLLRSFLVSLSLTLAFTQAPGRAAEAVQKQVSAGADDWPQWRGPNRNGVSESSLKLLDKWPADGPALAWKYPVFHNTPTDGGMGSPVVAEGSVVAFFNF